MHIAGGLYRELCQVPAWNAVFGSGGRAAAALSALSPNSTLHTYSDDLQSHSLTWLNELGIEMRISTRPSPIVFAYFHPLSRPHIQPPRDEISRQPSIKVSGDTVLRFGFLEGDAVVDANCAVYDPQTWHRPESFGANGSIAGKLAIVLNELELRSTTGLNDLHTAAFHLIEKQCAEVVIAKGGIRGAIVFERNGRATHIPAYRSTRVFKIGTGDVFSAIFAHYWAEKEMSAVEAAHLASRSVAAYCSTSRLPLSDDTCLNQDPIKFVAPGMVLLEGTVETLGQRYTMEEARFVLHELGVEVSCPVLNDVIDATPTAILVIADGLDEEALINVLRAKAAGAPVVVLREGGAKAVAVKIEGGEISVTDDFSSAIYFAAWAAAEHA